MLSYYTLIVVSKVKMKNFHNKYVKNKKELLLKGLLNKWS